MGVVEKIKKELKNQPIKDQNGRIDIKSLVNYYSSPYMRSRIIRLFKKVPAYLYYKTTGKHLLSNRNHQYRKWYKANKPDSSRLQEYAEKSKEFEYKPLFSIVMPVYRPDIKFLKQAIQSIQSQVYQNWELCIADDNSNDNRIINFLNQISSEYKNIKVHFRKENGHISACTNSALSMAEGDFICFMDQDDLIREDALYHFALHLNSNDHDIIYTDEDKINDKNRHQDHYFKPSWSPYSILANNYICHFLCIRKSIVDQVGGLRVGYEGCQDHDLILRATERTEKIFRIPEVLYHWRVHNNSTSKAVSVKNYAVENGVRAVQDALQRRGISAIVTVDENSPGHYKVDYKLMKKPKVSIIIPTKNNASILKTCIESIFEKSTYENYEIILLNNNSDEQALFSLIEDYQEKEGHRFKAVDQPFKFNYSKLMNNGVEAATGDFILLLNNDMEVISDDWIEQLLKIAQNKDVGAAGAKLLYPNNLIQHAGVVIGLGAAAGHIYVAAERDFGGYFNNLQSVTNYSAVTAACLMVDKKKFIEVGGFDENLAVEYNDVDFCLKLLDKGYNNVYSPEVEMYHYESLSRGHPHADSESYKQHIKEVSYFQGKWQHYVDDDPFYNPNLSRLTTTYDVNVPDV